MDFEYISPSENDNVAASGVVEILDRDELLFEWQS